MPRFGPAIQQLPSAVTIERIGRKAVAVKAGQTQRRQSH